MTTDTILQVNDFSIFTGNNQFNHSASNDLSDKNLNSLEKKAILQALAKHDGNVSHSAKELGLTRASLYRRLKKYEL